MVVGEKRLVDSARVAWSFFTDFSHSKLTIPPSLGYGNQKVGPIPAGSILGDFSLTGSSLLMLRVNPRNESNRDPRINLKVSIECPLLVHEVVASL